MIVKELIDLLNEANPNADIEVMIDNEVYPVSLYGYLCDDGGTEQTAKKVTLIADNQKNNYNNEN